MTPLRAGIVAALVALVLDQASKLWLLFVFDLGRRGAVAVTPFFDLVLAWNTGISYGWFQQDGPIGAAVLLGFKVVAVIALAIWMARSTTRLATIGLGLFIVRELTRAHGGDAFYDDDDGSAGAFVMRLPLPGRPSGPPPQ